MGKDSKHQRTKGGIQPSSASRTAELLEKTGAAGQPLSFLAAAAEARQEFSAFSSTILPGIGSGSPVHGILANVLIDEDLPSEVKLIFRKLQKKDATTKIKALGELSQLFEASPNKQSTDNSPNTSYDSTGAGDKASESPMDRYELSKTVLPQWSKNFPKLTVDDSRKVRELTQSTHALICKFVGRNLAPFLKQLTPHWYLAQFDIYGPVASAARKSFKTVFPAEKKQAEVIKFCINEIVAHVSNNLDAVFRVKKAETQQKGKKKQQANKKEKDANEQTLEEGTVEVDKSEKVSSSTSSNNTDSESYEIRTSFASLQCISNIIVLKLANEEFLDFLFGTDGVFWNGAEATKDIIIRRSCFDLLSTFVVNTVGETENQLEINIPADKCAKLMNHGLSVSTNQNSILPNIWNTFLILTLKGVLKDVRSAQKQLVTCCRNGFYSNASQIGPSVLPLLARIWEGITDDSKKSEYSAELTKSFAKGYETERSTFERAAILRTFAESIGFFIKNGISEHDVTHQFILENMKNINNEFPKLLGALVKDEDFYNQLIYKANDANLLNKKEFGNLVLGLVTPPTSLYADQQSFVRKGPRVQFNEPTANNANVASSKNQPSFTSLPEHKQTFLQLFVETCISAHAYPALSVISRYFKHPDLWESVHISEIDLSKEEDKYIRLNLSLDLIDLHPDSPQILGIFSDQFEYFKEPSDLQMFLKEVSSFIHLIPIKKWIRMSIFTDEIEKSLNTATFSEAELVTVLKFVLKGFLPDNFMESVINILSSRIDVDNVFYDNVARIMAYSTFPVDLSTIYGKFWEIYFQKTVDAVEDQSLELAESVCLRNVEKVSSQFLMGKLEQQLEACRTVKQISNLVDVCRKADFADEDIELAIRSPALNIKADVIAFVGLNHSNINHDVLDVVQKFAAPHMAVILKAIFHGRFVQSDEPDETLVEPLINVLYAQAVARLWAAIEESDYFDHVNEDFTEELEIISSRLIEQCYSKPNLWKEMKIKLGKAAGSLDPIWASKLPVSILKEYCEKSEINFKFESEDSSGHDDTTVMAAFDIKSEADNILAGFTINDFQVKKNIEWLTEKRKDNSEEFEFETLFRHTKDKALLNKLLQILLKLLERVESENEEFLSSGTCWIEAWLKHSKYVETSSKTNLLWISNLSKAVKVIGDKARNCKDAFPNFPQEYVEFHCAQIYPIIYSLYLQLNTEVTNHSFWTMQALYYVSQALSTMPGSTLAFIEPDSIKICDTFSNILGNGVNRPTRIAAYKVLRKVKYDTGEAKDLPIIPPGIDDVIKSLLEKLRLSEMEVLEGLRHTYDEERKHLVSYLLIWDALLKIQQKSNEFASYVRDQEHLLTPFLNTLFFSESIPIENATPKCFDTDPELIPGHRINLLHLSCAVLQRSLRTLPYTVRWWWNTHVTKQRDRVFVEKFVVKHLSSKLAAEELGGVKLRDGIDDNVTIQCHSGCNELIAHYRIEETNVTLTISLPLNHPLGPVTVRISDKKLHAKISHLLNTRSHSLSAGLKLWKENLDGLYKDVDECAICFFILHHVTKQTPKLGCKTCRKKFHAACLYKWFSTSNKSECPLCRNLF